MHQTLARASRLAAALTLTGAAFTAASAALAQPGAQPATAQEVTVFAPKVARHVPSAASPFLGAPIEVVSLKRAVSYADLDLTRQAGVATFEQRIRGAAQTACADLEAAYPSNLYVPTPPDQNCVETATNRAMDTAKQVVLAANSK